MSAEIFLKGNHYSKETLKQFLTAMDIKYDSNIHQKKYYILLRIKEHRLQRKSQAVDKSGFNQPMEPASAASITGAASTTGASTTGTSRLPSRLGTATVASTMGSAVGSGVISASNAISSKAGSSTIMFSRMVWLKQKISKAAESPMASWALVMIALLPVR